MRLRHALAGALGCVAAAALAWLPGAPAVAADGAPGLTLQLQGTAAAPVVVLTNHSGESCQVFTTADGTLIVTRAAQNGAAVAAYSYVPGYVEEPSAWLRTQLRTLASGESQELPLDVAATGAEGTFLVSTSWSPGAAFGLSYPIEPQAPLSLDASYVPPVAPQSGPPLCAAVSGSGDLTAMAAASPGGRSRWLLIAAAALLVLLVVVLVLVLVTVRRRGARGRTSAAVLLLVVVAVGVAVVGSPQRAGAIINVPDDLADDWDACLAKYEGAGGDFASMIQELRSSPDVVDIMRSGGNSDFHLVGPHRARVEWNPNNTTPYTDGVLPEKCPALFHELFHAWQWFRGTYNPRDCWYHGVNLHIPVYEVMATGAENLFRDAIHSKRRTKWGGVDLPPVCEPPPAPTSCQPTAPGVQRAPLVSAEGRLRLAEDCAPPPPGRHTSDPHVGTFDGLRYDFQAVGEFVETRDTTTSGFEVQVRQSQVNGSRYVSANSAIAADVAGDRVQISLDRGVFTLLVNGSETAIGDVALPRGGAVRVTLEHFGLQFRVDWPDGSYGLVQQYGVQTLTVLLWPAAVHSGHLTGLLGDFDGVSANDAAAGLGFDQLYPGYADSLRITDATSLFTYAPGTSTATYSDPTFPDAQPPGVDAAWAQQLCQAEGIADATSLRECEVDLTQTGSAQFLGADIAAQDPAVGGPGLTSFAAPGQAQTLTAPGAFTFDAVAGQRVYLAVTATTLPDSCDVPVLVDPSGTVIATGCVNGGAGSLDAERLPATGTYQVVAQPASGAIGTITMSLYVSDDIIGTVTADGAAVTTAVTTPGQVARLVFPAAANERVFAQIDASTLPAGCFDVSFRGTAGLDRGAAEFGCVDADGTGFIDTIALANGDYAIVLDPHAATTASLTVRLFTVQDHSQATSINAAATLATVASPGSQTLLLFSGMAGQSVTVEATGATPALAGCDIALVNPGGATVELGCVRADGSMTLGPQTLTQTGTYAIRVDPDGSATGSVSLRVHT